MRLNIEVEPNIYKRLKAESAKKGRSISDVVRALINDWLVRQALESYLVDEIRSETRGENES